MADFDLLPDGFVQGVIEYIDNMPDSDDSKIIVPVAFGDSSLTFAIIDTGTPFSALPTLTNFDRLFPNYNLT